MTLHTPTHEKQARLLVDAGMRSSAGLSAEHLRREIAERFQYISYRRFEAYWQNHLDNTQPGTQLRFHPATYWEDILACYMFDRQLRRIVFDALSRIEIAMRALAAHRWSENTNNDTPQRSSNNYSASFPVGTFLSTADANYQTSSTDDAVRYRKQYADVRVFRYL